MSATSFPIYSVAKALVRYLPGFLLRRYYTPERLASLVYCDVLPRGESVQLDLGPVASARLFLQLINLSPFYIEFDSAQLVMQCGGAKIEFVHVSPRIAIASCMTTQLDLCTTIHGGSSSAIIDKLHIPLKAWLTGHMELSCSIGKLTKALSLSDIRPVLINAQLRKTECCGS